MKHVTASEARKNWFRLLDEVAAGAVVVIERHGRRIVIHREAEALTREGIPDYGPLISADAADRADEWSWEWAEGELSPIERRRPESSRSSADPSRAPAPGSDG